MGAFFYNCRKRGSFAVLANTTILNISAKRIDFKRSVDQVFLVSAIQAQRLDERLTAVAATVGVLSNQQS